MKFAGLTNRSRAEAYMRALREQRVFGMNQEILEPKNEIIFHVGGLTLRRLSYHTLVQVYWLGISTERVAPNWKMALGIVTTAHEIDQPAFDKVQEEALPFINHKNNYAELRWHDIVLLLLLHDNFQAELHQYADFHLTRLLRLAPGLAAYFEKIRTNVAN